MGPEQWFEVVKWAAMAGAIYGGIRADIKAIHAAVKAAADSAAEAHRRIDQQLLRRRTDD